jgi:hypothetical protein
MKTDSALRTPHSALTDPEDQIQEPSGWFVTVFLALVLALVRAGEMLPTILLGVLYGVATTITAVVVINHLASQ